MDERTERIGYRVASLRKLAGMTQAKLASTAHVSVSLVRQVERGKVPASGAFTAAVARALGLDVTTLTCQPYDDLVSAPRSEAAGIPALRQVLSEHDNPAPVVELLSIEELRARLDAGNRLCVRARYAELARRLPEVLGSLYAHQAQPPRGERANEQLAELLDDAYALAAAAAHRFGYLDLAAQVDDRRPLTAAATGDPLRVAGEAFVRTWVSLHRGDYDGCTRLVERAWRAIGDRSDPTALAVRGQLHLQSASIAARAARGQDADAHLAEARDIIASGVPSHPYIDIDCSAFNADAHFVAIPVELLDGATAVARAQSVHVADDGEPRRVGAYWVKVARGWVLHGDRAKALESLNKARAVSPQQTRYHHGVREMVRLMAETDRRMTDSLAGFARWAGITI
ncbi:MAG: helix-turn-helix domain-containing protein [Pseudonocardiaceae bacterium]